MAEPSVHECTFPVDVVYTWVDGDDPVWDQARRDRLAALSGTASETAQTRESSGQARFVSRNELRYSLRSVHLFAPWVRRIHLVTAGQVPDWLDVDHPQVALVDHSAILPADALPTFNSHAIESSLHKVPDLAEHFVYFNDDFFLGRPLRPEAFFSPAGLAAVFLSPNPIGLSDQPDAPPYLKAAWNNRRLLQGAFGRVITDNLAHAPYPHRRSVLEELEARFPEAIARTARSPVPLGHRRLDAELAGPALRADDGLRVRRGRLACLRERLQQRPRLAAQTDPRARPGLHLPGRPPRPRPQRRSAQPHAHGVHGGVLPDRGPVGAPGNLTWALWHFGSVPTWCRFPRRVPQETDKCSHARVRGDNS